MTEKKSDLYKELKVFGKQKEQQLNSKIQELINNRELIESVSRSSQMQVPEIIKMQEASERRSIIMNYPTKKDVANIAKLVLQLEEKIDKLEELLSTVIPERNGFLSSQPSLSDLGVVYSLGSKKMNSREESNKKEGSKKMNSRGESNKKEENKKRILDLINQLQDLKFVGQRNRNV
ncbi:hypothetical protein [Peribacillus butanolivorans]|uniref:hypothetical protein n=1 Tax=Peribacillus butanolivorans TaxID=421767 RepID=UPI00380633BB